MKMSVASNKMKEGNHKYMIISHISSFYNLVLQDRIFLPQQLVAMSSPHTPCSPPALSPPPLPLKKKKKKKKKGRRRRRRG